MRRAGARPEQRHPQPVRPSSATTSPIGACTGPALAVSSRRSGQPGRGCGWPAFVAASGSAGTLAAGDYLKEQHGARIVAVEASECPTLLRNGFGEHNIQGIGDKHVPLIHNVMNTDIVVGVSERSTGALDLLFNSETGRDYLSTRRQIDPVASRRARAAGAVGHRQPGRGDQDGKAARSRRGRPPRHRRHRHRRALRQRARQIPRGALSRRASMRSTPARLFGQHLSAPPTTTCSN